MRSAARGPWKAAEGPAGGRAPPVPAAAAEGLVWSYLDKTRLVSDTPTAPVAGGHAATPFPCFRPSIPLHALWCQVHLLPPTLRDLKGLPTWAPPSSAVNPPGSDCPRALQAGVPRMVTRANLPADGGEGGWAHHRAPTVPPSRTRESSSILPEAGRPSCHQKGGAGTWCSQASRSTYSAASC